MQAGGRRFESDRLQVRVRDPRMVLRGGVAALPENRSGVPVGMSGFSDVVSHGEEELVISSVTHAADNPCGVSVSVELLSDWTRRAEAPVMARMDPACGRW